MAIKGKPITIRFPSEEFINRIKAVAKAEDRSLNYMVIQLLKEALKNR